MAFLRRLKSVIFGESPPDVVTVKRLVDRLKSATLPEDRRGACRALTNLSFGDPIDFGTDCIDALRQVLELDRADTETIKIALETLINVMYPIQIEEVLPGYPYVPTNFGDHLIERFIKDQQNIQLLLDFLEEFDVCSAALELLTCLANQREIQKFILVKPMVVSKIMGLLGDPKKYIRHPTISLLIELTRHNANIKKIVAFENAFDRLFDIVLTEGYHSGFIVDKCLILMVNLLVNHNSNINLFIEGCYILKMLPMFNTPDSWSPQKVSSVHYMLQIVRTLVSPSNAIQIISSCQKIMKNVGLLDALCNILIASDVPADILTETINTVGEVIRGEVVNEEFLGNVMAPSNPPRPVIVVLLMSMVNEKQPFLLRCAVLYCFQCFLYHNEMAQASLVQTLLPSYSDVPITSGQLLCGGLLSFDALSNWFAAVALRHALIDNSGQKEQLLGVTNIGGAPVSLLHRCTLTLQQVTKLQQKMALLMLLSEWTSHCPAAVSAFLRVPRAVDYLLYQICSKEHGDNDENLLQGLSAFLLAICIHFNDDSVENYSKDSLKQVLLERIGMETFRAKLSEVTKHDLYNNAATHPQLRVKMASEILIDYEFCKLFDGLESVVTKSLTVKQETGVTERERVSDEATLDLIRQQEARLQQLTQQVDRLLLHNHQLQGALNDAIASNSHLKEENALLKANQSGTGLLNILRDFLTHNRHEALGHPGDDDPTEPV